MNNLEITNVSIIMPVRFVPNLTRVALDSLFLYTKGFELVLVQDGEDAEMKELLRGYDAKVVYNEKPEGYVKAINKGFKEISENTKYVMFLNSDTCCTPNWLEEMLKCFDLDPKVGLVVPTFTAWGGIQSIEENIKYGDYNFCSDVVGVCMLFSKEVINTLMDKVEEQGVIGGGILDERFEIGGGDDNDIAMRVGLCGYKTIVARKSFIYHYISASFRKLFNDDIDVSKKHAAKVFTKFQEKWKEELGSKPHVLIAIPTATGNISHELVIRMIEWTHDPNFVISLRFYPFLFPLDNARNRAVKDFLEDYYTHLLFIDDDIIPPRNCLSELLKADKEIIAPVCFTWGRDDNGLPFPQPVSYRYNKDGKYELYVGKGIDETDIVTGGMFLVKREVYEKLERPFYFTYHKNGVAICSEDFVFSQQCQKLGYKLYTHFDLHCGHLKVVDVKDINDLMVKIIT
jgi:GT2 family glycosyltransferase